MGHLKSSEAEGFLAGQLKPATRRRVVRHLLSGCDSCREMLQAATLPEIRWTTSAAEPDEVYDACIDRAREAVRSFEARRQEDRERFDQALARVRSRGWGQLTRAERQAFQGTVAHVELLLQLSFEARHRDPQEMLLFADSALEAVERLPATSFEEVLHCDLRARVWAEVSNACRVNELFGRAETALKKARLLLQQGTGDLLVQARVDEVDASLHKDEYKLAEAEALLVRAYRTYRSLGELHLAGRTLVTRALFVTIAERPLEAVPILREALSLLNESSDPQLVVMAYHNLLFALVEAGEIREASQILLENGFRQKFKDDPLNLLRVRWLEGKILAGRGRLADAERVLGEVRNGFWDRGLEFVATVVGLDEAKALLQQGKTGRLHELSKELYERARDRGVHREAQNALQCFEIVCRLRVATLENADRVRLFIDRLHNIPGGLRWKAELLFS